MAQAKITREQADRVTKQKVAFGVLAIFVTQFVSYLFINARNIAQPQIIAEFDGMALFSWLIALPALAGSASTLLFGILSDTYGGGQFYSLRWPFSELGWHSPLR
jgi:MFS family permease